MAFTVMHWEVDFTTSEVFFAKIQMHRYRDLKYIANTYMYTYRIQDTTNLREVQGVG